MAGFDTKSALQMPIAVTIKKFTGIGQVGSPEVLRHAGVLQPKIRDGGERRARYEFFGPPPG